LGHVRQNRLARKSEPTSRITKIRSVSASLWIAPQELVGLQPDIILTQTATATVALQRETRTIPIISVGAVDPVASGVVPRLDRPNGTINVVSYEDTLGGMQHAGPPASPFPRSRPRAGWLL